MKVDHVEFMPEVKAPGTLYISDRFELAIHKCPCGCGIDAVTPLGEGDWTLSKHSGGVTLSPSLLNPCGTHYWIRDSQIVPA